MISCDWLEPWFISTFKVLSCRKKVMPWETLNYMILPQLISAADRHRQSTDHPIKFISRRQPNTLKFKIKPGTYFKLLTSFVKFVHTLVSDVIFLSWLDLNQHNPFKFQRTWIWQFWYASEEDIFVPFPSNTTSSDLCPTDPNFADGSCKYSLP